MSLLFREWKRDILNFSEWPVATRAALSQKLRRVWLKPGLSHCEKTLVSQLPFRMWNPGCDLSRWATSAYCGNEAVTETHKSPEKSIRTVSMVERIQMQGSVTFECDFFFFFPTGWSALNMQMAGSDPSASYHLWLLSVFWRQTCSVFHSICIWEG